MALPIMAGPGAMSVAISLGAGSPHLWAGLGDVGGALAVLTFLNYACLLLGEPIVKKMGCNGMDAFNKVLGFLVLGIGISLMVSGVEGLIRGGLR
jgi:multiple antibiotic resistance protein